MRYAPNLDQNLVVHDSSVLKAFSPYFAGWYLVRNKTEGWKSLGGILLAFTGVEALFADLGAFTRPAIQLSWLFFAWPCLLLAYIGQAAYISRNRAAWSNPFFNAVPPGMFYPSLVIAILAAIVASQAMITAVFQLLSQIMKLSYFPQIKLVHTSKIFRGQIYIPYANWLMMIGTIIVTAVYNNTTKLGHAYGFCVILVTFITTSMVALVALIVWRLPLIVVTPCYVIFAALDGLYLSSSATKIPDGAWFTLVLAVVLSSIFILWRFGKEQQWRAEASDRFPLAYMLTSQDGTSKDLQTLCFTAPFGGSSISSINGMGIFFDKAGARSTTPTVFVHFLQKFHATCEVAVFFHLRPLPIPSVPVEERYSVTRCFISTPGEKKLPMQSWFRVVIRHGYTDEVITHDLGMLVFDQVRNFIIREGAEEAAEEATRTTHISFQDQPSGACTTESTQRKTPIRPSLEQMHVSEKLADLHRAYESQVVYVVGKEQMRIVEDTPLFRRVALNAFLWLRDNTRSKVQALNLATDKLIEVGFVKEV
jgi:KUP system potassium uptake protein